MLTPTAFAPGAGSLSERLPVADAEVVVGDPGVRTRTDEDGRFVLRVPGSGRTEGSRATPVAVRIDDELVLEQEVLVRAAPSVTQLELLVPMLPDKRFLGGVIEQLGGSVEPGTLEVEVLDDRGRELARSGRGSPGDWRLQFTQAPRPWLTVVLLRDGRPVDSQQLRELGEGIELSVPTLQLP